MEISSAAKPTMEFNGRNYVLEETIRGDIAFVRAWKADESGNLIFNKTARNFNQDIATASKCVIAEVEEIVPVGTFNPDEVHVPGVYVKHVYKG